MGFRVFYGNGVRRIPDCLRREFGVSQRFVQKFCCVMAGGVSGRCGGDLLGFELCQALGAGDDGRWRVLADQVGQGIGRMGCGLGLSSQLQQFLGSGNSRSNDPGSGK